MVTATIPERKEILPTCKGTVVCQQCTAEYSPGIWYRGFNAEKGTGVRRFVKTETIPFGYCPICRTKD